MGTNPSDARNQAYAAGLEGLRPVLIKVALRRVRNRAAAEDIASQAILITYGHLADETLNDPTQFDRYATRTVQFLCNEWKRYQHRHPGVTGPDDPTTELPDPAPESTEGLCTAELIAMVRQCVRELPTARDRWILTEYFVKDRDKESICREGKLDPVHFNRVLHRAKNRLGELMLKAGHDPADYLSLLIFALAAGLTHLP